MMAKKSKHKSINDMGEIVNSRFGIKKNSTATKNRITGYTETMDSTSLIHENHHSGTADSESRFRNNIRSINLMKESKLKS